MVFVLQEDRRRREKIEAQAGKDAAMSRHQEADDARNHSG
jgi:hypothetical protein